MATPITDRKQLPDYAQTTAEQIEDLGFKWEFNYEYPVPDPNETQRVQIRDEIKGQKGRDRNTLFDAGLRDTLVKQGKIKYHNDVISRLLASYRPS